MTDVGKYVFQEVKYVINAVGCSEKYYFLVKKKSTNVYVQIVPVSCNDMC